MNARAQTRSMVLRFSTGAQTKDDLRDGCECAISCISETRFGFMQGIIGDGAPYIRPNSGRGFPLTKKCLRDPTQRHMMRVGPKERPCRILARMRGDFCPLSPGPAKCSAPRGIDTGVSAPSNYRSDATLISSRNDLRSQPQGCFTGGRMNISLSRRARHGPATRASGPLLSRRTTWLRTRSGRA